MGNIKNSIRELLISSKIYESKAYMSFAEKRRSRRFHKNGMETLKRLKKAFEETGKVYWLDYGTLLGAVRDKDFIPHDLDLDVGALIEEREDKLQEALIANGLTKVREFRVDGEICEETYTYNGADIDIFYYHQEKDKLWCYSFTDEKPLAREKSGKKVVTRGWDTYKVTMTYTGFENIPFKGIEFNAPADKDLYLKENYGNYMVPVKDWDFTQLASNIEKINVKDVIGINYYE